MKNRFQYPQEWFDTIRPAVLKRDGYKCTTCGIAHRATGYYDHKKIFIPCDEFMIAWAQKQGFKIQKIHLQVAHLNHKKDDCRTENLETKCPKCHLNYDRAFNQILRRMRGRQQGTGGGAARSV